MKILPDESLVSRASVPDATPGAIVQMLLESGSITAVEIGRRLGISAAGVRRHSTPWWTVATPSSTRPRRGSSPPRPPGKRYRLTSAGRAKLEHTYDDLASAAMRQLREIGGDDAVRTFARRRIQAILDGLNAPLPTTTPRSPMPPTRVADALTRAGYATTATRVGG